MPDAHELGSALISNTTSPPPAICAWRMTGASTRTPFTVSPRTYGFVAAPGAEMTSGAAACGRSSVTRSKNGLRVRQGVRAWDGETRAYLPTTYSPETGSTG